MKIKNVKTLRLRANAHARHDRIAQGTYGDASINGHAEFEGCAIACLSTPHTQKGLRAFLRGIFGGSGEGCLTRYGWTPEDQRKALQKEFGICRTLALVLEGIFESQTTHGAAIEFIPAFAKAMVEGSDIKPRELRKSFSQFLVPEGPFKSEPENYRVIDCGDEAIEEATEAFLQWLKSRPAI